MSTVKKEGSCRRNRVEQRLSPQILVPVTSHKTSLNLTKAQQEETLKCCVQARGLQSIHEIDQMCLHQMFQIAIMKQHSKLKLILKAHKNKFKPG